MSTAPTQFLAPVPTIEAYLQTALQTCRHPQSDPLNRWSEYAVLQGGKRLRPLLAWYCCEAFGAPGEKSLPAGAAVELVHAFSLVHDDLPALDNDDLRRGKPTLHKHAGEAAAILTGDALLNLAYAHLAMHAPRAIAVELVRHLGTATHAMVCGQIHDTLGIFDSTLDAAFWVKYIHHNKTGALMQASCIMGMLCGLEHAGKLELAAADGDGPFKRIGTYGAVIGLMFQIVDDILDVTQTAEQTGKRTGKDQEAGKLTYPGVFGVEESRTHVESCRAAALRALEDFGPEAQPLRDLCGYLAVRTQ